VSENTFERRQDDEKQYVVFRLGAEVFGVEIRRNPLYSMLKVQDFSGRSANFSKFKIQKRNFYKNKE